MRKEYICIVVLISCIIGIVYGVVRVCNNAYNTDKTEASIEILNNVENVSENNEVVPTVVAENKVSPNCSFALKKFYDECNHFEYEEVELPNELVNLTRQEVDEYYDGWEVEEFLDNKLVLCKEINGYCNQHFVIRLDDSNVNIYRMGTLGELQNYKSTDISIDYLPNEDIEELREGIMVFGEGKLSSVLEDYE